MPTEAGVSSAVNSFGDAVGEKLRPIFFISSQRDSAEIGIRTRDYRDGAIAG